MMCIRRFVMIAALCCLWIGGCTQEQIEDVDNVLADANAVTTGVVELVQGPAGAVFPPIVRTIAELLGIGLAAALAVWQQIKHKLTRQTLTAVTKGVEKLEEIERLKAKTEIALEMNEIASSNKGLSYSKLNAEVDKAKASG